MSRPRYWLSFTISGGERVRLWFYTAGARTICRRRLRGAQGVTEGARHE